MVVGSNGAELSTGWQPEEPPDNWRIEDVLDGLLDRAGAITARVHPDRATVGGDRALGRAERPPVGALRETVGLLDQSAPGS
jgi:hypothetical protein